METTLRQGSGGGRVIRSSALVPRESRSVSIPTGEHRQTEVHLIRQGDTVQEIEVTCSCGEVIRLVCQYD